MEIDRYAGSLLCTIKNTESQGFISVTRHGFQWSKEPPEDSDWYRIFVAVVNTTNQTKSFSAKEILEIKHAVLLCNSRCKCLMENILKSCFAIETESIKERRRGKQDFKVCMDFLYDRKLEEETFSKYWEMLGRPITTLEDLRRADYVLRSLLQAVSSFKSYHNLEMLKELSTGISLEENDDFQHLPPEVIEHPQRYRHSNMQSLAYFALNQFFSEKINYKQLKELSWVKSGFQFLLVLDQQLRSVERSFLTAVSYHDLKQICQRRNDILEVAYQLKDHIFHEFEGEVSSWNQYIDIEFPYYRRNSYLCRALKLYLDKPENVYSEDIEKFLSSRYEVDASFIKNQLAEGKLNWLHKLEAARPHPENYYSEWIRLKMEHLSVMAGSDEAAFLHCIHNLFYNIPQFLNEPKNLYSLPAVFIDFLEGRAEHTLYKHEALSSAIKAIRGASRRKESSFSFASLLTIRNKLEEVLASPLSSSNFPRWIVNPEVKLTAFHQIEESLFNGMRAQDFIVPLRKFCSAASQMYSHKLIFPKSDSLEQFLQGVDMGRCEIEHFDMIPSWQPKIKSLLRWESGPTYAIEGRNLEHFYGEFKHKKLEADTLKITETCDGLQLENLIGWAKNNPSIRILLEIERLDFSHLKADADDLAFLFKRMESFTLSHLILGPSIDDCVLAELPYSFPKVDNITIGTADVTRNAIQSVLAKMPLLRHLNVGSKVSSDFIRFLVDTHPLLHSLTTTYKLRHYEEEFQRLRPSEVEWGTVPLHSQLTMDLGYFDHLKGLTIGPYVSLNALNNLKLYCPQLTRLKHVLHE